MSDSIAYFHGGPQGLKPGDHVLPPDVTGAQSTADLGGEGVCRRDRVYVTTDPNAALMFACAHKKPMVYLVEPLDFCERDPDCTTDDLSWACPRAKVLDCIKPDRRLVNVARQALLR